MAQDIVRTAQDQLKAVSDTIAALERQLAAAHTERNDLQAFLRTYQRLTAKAPPTTSGLIETLTRTFTALGTAVEASETLRTAMIARQIVEREGRPVKLGDLYSFVTATGQTFGGQNPVNTFAARLSNSREKVKLISIPGVGWWLSEKPWPDAGYAGNATESEAQASDSAS